MRIFSKHLLVYLGTIIISFVFLGLVLTQAMRGFLTDQRASELTSLARRVSMSMENFTALGGVRNLHLLAQELSNIHSYTDATIIIIDSNYNVMISHGLPPGSFPQIDAFEEIAPVMRGEVVAVFGTSHHPILEPLLFAGYPFWVGGEVAGAALVGFSMAELETAIGEMYRITMIALLITGAFTFILIYTSSRSISRPLRQINDAAKVIADGDLEKRIPVHGKDEVAELAKQFNKMAESLGDQEKKRNAFIANISHDIRSPLTSMKGFLIAINDGIIPPSEQPYYINIVLDESERLIKLANDILDLNRLQEMEITLGKTDFDIVSLVRQTILGFSRLALDKKIMITSHFAHPEDFVSADEDKIRRVLYNLIDNALKFTEADGEIIVETTITKEKVEISISDNGSGMTEEEKKYIFDRFYKGDSSRGKDKMGSGIGLSIVKAFIRAHGEDLWVESSLESGSVFYFTLPLAN